MSHASIDTFTKPYHSFALLWLRTLGALLLLWVHGLPKAINFSAELARIEDPFHLGATPTLLLAVFAEVVCPLLIIAGVFTRLACLPIVAVLIIALGVVHPEWSMEEGQFGWLFLLVFSTLLISGPGEMAIQARWSGVWRLV